MYREELKSLEGKSVLVKAKVTHFSCTKLNKRRVLLTDILVNDSIAVDHMWLPATYFPDYTGGESVVFKGIVHKYIHKAIVAATIGFALSKYAYGIHRIKSIQQITEKL